MALAGGRFERVLEIGCGPFTQLALLLHKSSAKISKEVVLVDPLLGSYMNIR